VAGAGGERPASEAHFAPEVRAVGFVVEVLAGGRDRADVFGREVGEDLLED